MSIGKALLEVLLKVEEHRKLARKMLIIEKPKAAQLVEDANRLIGLLKERKYGDRNRLFRKLVEEAGEYAEAIELNDGATRKLLKYKDVDPKEKLKEEISDVAMVALALARCDGNSIEDVLSVIVSKLSQREEEYQRAKKNVG